MKIVKIKGRGLASVVLTGEELLEILPIEVLEIIEENDETDLDKIGLGVNQKYVITAPICEIEDTPGAIKEAIEIQGSAS